MTTTNTSVNKTSNQINIVPSQNKTIVNNFSNQTTIINQSQSSTSNVNKNQTSAASQPKVTNLNSWVFNPAQSASQIYGIWYPYSTSQTPFLSSYDSKAFVVYQLIINPARLFLSGGCNTMFSSYTFASSSFQNLNISQTKQVCPNSYDQIISDIVFGNNIFTFSGSGPNSILAIKSKNNIVLMMFNQTPPLLN